MKLIKISYEMGDGRSLTAGIISMSKEKALDFLYTKVGSGIRVHTLSVVHDIHGVDDEIINNTINNNPRVKKYKDRIKQLNERCLVLEEENERMQTLLDKEKQQPSSKDIKDALQSKVYSCPYCDKEFTNKTATKQHITKMHKDK